MSKILITGSINTDMVVRTQHIPKPGETILGNYFLLQEVARAPTRLSLQQDSAERCK